MRGRWLLALTTPLLGVPGVAMAIDVTVSPTAAGLCDPGADADCHATVAGAIDAVNAAAQAANTVTIDAAVYTGGETQLPDIDFPTTLQADLPTADYSWELPPIWADTSLVLNRIRVRSDERIIFESGTAFVAAVSVYGGSLTATDVVARSTWESTDVVHNADAAAYVSNGDVDVDALDAAGFEDSGVVVETGLAPAPTVTLANSLITDNNGIRYASGLDVALADTVTIIDTEFVGNGAVVAPAAVDIGAVGSLAISGGRFDANAGGVRVGEADAVTLVDTDFTNGGSVGPAVNLEAGVSGLSVSGGLFDDNVEGGIRAEPGGDFTMEVTGTTFTNHGHFQDPGQGGFADGRGAIDVEVDDWDDFPVIDVTVTGATFANNRSDWDANDITYEAPAGRLLVTDTTFAHGDATWGFLSPVDTEGLALFRDVTFTGPGLGVVDGGEDLPGLSEDGGAIVARGVLDCLRCTFDGTLTVDSFFFGGRGGAILLEDSEAPYTPTVALIQDSVFNGTGATIGGAIAVEPGAEVEIRRSSFVGTRAKQGGAVEAATWGPSGRRGLQVEALQVIGYFGPIPTARVEIEGSTFEDVGARNGGALYLGDGSVTLVRDSTFDGATASREVAFEGGEGLPFPPGNGGLAVVEPGARLDIRDSEITDTLAEEAGGVLASMSDNLRQIFSQIPQAAFSGPVLPGPKECAFPGEYADFDEEDDYGAEIVLSGVQQDTSGALAGSVAYFGRYDRVHIEASEFSNNTAEVDGTFYVDNASYFEMHCSTVCGNTVGRKGAAIYFFDDGYGNEFSGDGGEGQRDVHYAVENNVFQDNAAVPPTGVDPASGVVQFEFCDSGTGSFGDTGFDTDFPSDSGDSGDTGDFQVPSPQRGRLRIVNNTLVGNDADDGLVHGVGADVRIDITNNVLDGGDVGIFLEDTRYVTGGFNLFDVVDPLDGEAEDHFTPATGSPTYMSYTAGTCDSVLVLTPTSVGFDTGDPNLFDPDASRSDVGAYGGPEACIPDEDGDGFDVTMDCDDRDGNINPDSYDLPYDGVDQDCTGSDACDADGDGHDATICGGDDCNDADATIFGGAPDEPYDGIDQDCDGHDDCDLDADGFEDEECGGRDCDDGSATVHPGAEEVPYDEIDQDCDGADLCDADADGALAPECGGDDCDDTDPTIYPGAPEVPDDGIDQSCDGEDRTRWVQGGCACAVPGAPAVPWLAIGVLGLVLRRRREESR